MNVRLFAATGTGTIRRRRVRRRRRERRSSSGVGGGDLLSQRAREHFFCDFAMLCSGGGSVYKSRGVCHSSLASKYPRTHPRVKALLNCTVICAILHLHTESFTAHRPLVGLDSLLFNVVIRNVI